MVKYGAKGSVKTKKHAGTLVLLLILITIAIILTVAIIVINSNKKDDELVEIDFSQFEDIPGEDVSRNNALSDCYIIRMGFEAGGVGFDETKQEYEVNMSTDDSVYNTYITICYAEFVYKYGGGIEDAKNVMLLAEPLPNDLDVWISYYASFRDLYLEAGDEDGAAYCNGILNRLSPSDAPEEEINVYKEEE